MTDLPIWSASPSVVLLPPNIRETESSRFAFTKRMGSKISSAMLDYSIGRYPLRNLIMHRSSGIKNIAFIETNR